MTKMDEDRQIIWRPIVWCGIGEGGAREGIKDLIDMMDLDRRRPGQKILSYFLSFYLCSAQSKII